MTWTTNHNKAAVHGFQPITAYVGYICCQLLVATLAAASANPAVVSMQWVFDVNSTVSGIDGLGLDVLNLVDIRGESNYELAMRLQTSIANEEREFYTDLNGFQACYCYSPAIIHYWSRPNNMIIDKWLQFRVAAWSSRISSMLYLNCCVLVGRFLFLFWIFHFSFQSFSIFSFQFCFRYFAFYCVNDQLTRTHVGQRYCDF